MEIRKTSEKRKPNEGENKFIEYAEIDTTIRKVIKENKRKILL